MTEVSSQALSRAVHFPFAASTYVDQIWMHANQNEMNSELIEEVRVCVVVVFGFYFVHVFCVCKIDQPVHDVCMHARC